MFRSFIISAIRNMLRNKVQSIIQIFSLAVGLTVFTFVMLYLYDELTVDRTVKDHEQVYRVEFSDAEDHTCVPLAVGTVLSQHIPEITSMTRFHHEGRTDRIQFLVHFDESKDPGQQVVRVSVVASVDSGFSAVFSPDFIEGDPGTALKDPHTIVLTESVSEKLFGQQSPMGQTVYFRNLPHMVTGLVKDPVNTHLQYEALISIVTKQEIIEEEWGWATDYLMSTSFNLGVPTYVRLTKYADKKEVEEKMSNTWKQFVRKLDPDYDSGWEIYLRPLKDVYLAGGEGLRKQTKSGNHEILEKFFLLGLIVMLLGIVNYVNLSTARTSARAREISIKKIVGSSRLQLIFYFLTESGITTMLSFLLALSFLQLLFPRFNQLLLAEIDLYFLSRPLPWIICILLILLVGILSGLYPSLIMSSGFSIAPHNKGIKFLNRSINSRRILIIMQFTATVILMIGVFVTQRQIRFMKKLDPGFNADQILSCNMGELFTFEPDLVHTLKSRLKKYPGITGVSFSQGIPGYPVLREFRDPNSPSYRTSYGFMWIDEDYIDLFGLKLVQGSGFHGLLPWDPRDRYSKKSSLADSTLRTPCIINEAMMDAVGLTEPIGTFLDELCDGRSEVLDCGYQVVGVVEDFHFQSFKNDIKPLVLCYGENYFKHLNLKVHTRKTYETLREVDREIEMAARSVYQKKNKQYIHRPYEFTPLTDLFDSLYIKEQRLADSFLYLSVLALLIACLGLFGLSTFVVQRRTREIGIRKAMGSSERQIFVWLAKDFIKWIGLSILIGCPIGWWVMNKWLQHFAYRTNISIWAFIVTTAIAFSIAFLTIARQSWKTARANPLDALRYE